MQIFGVEKSTARLVPRFCSRVFRCCSVGLKPQWTAAHRTVRQTTPWETFVFWGSPLGGDIVPPMFSPNIYPRHIVNASGLLVTLGMAMRPVRPPDRSPVRARVELKSCPECITLLMHYPSSYNYLFQRNRYISNMFLMTICDWTYYDIFLAHHVCTKEVMNAHRCTLTMAVADYIGSVVLSWQIAIRGLNFQRNHPCLPSVYHDKRKRTQCVPHQIVSNHMPKQLRVPDSMFWLPLTFRLWYSS